MLCPHPHPHCYVDEYIIPANNLHMSLLLVTNILHINNILQYPMLSVYINTNYPHFETCHVMYQYYLVKFIIPMCY